MTELYIGNDNVIELIGLKNGLDNTYINNAIVQVTLKDSVNAEVIGQDWPAPMEYVPGSDGTYRGLLSADLELMPNQSYYAYITATGSGLPTASWRRRYVALYRGSEVCADA